MLVKSKGRGHTRPEEQASLNSAFWGLLAVAFLINAIVSSHLVPIVLWAIAAVASVGLAFTNPQSRRHA